jgi:glucoamylase
MFPLVPFIVLAYFVLYVLALVQLPAGGERRWETEKTDLGPQMSLETWLTQEKKTSLRQLLQNVSPHGENALGAVPGTVLASPSKKDPDYYYQCKSNLIPSVMLTGQGRETQQSLCQPW